MDVRTDPADPHCRGSRDTLNGAMQGFSSTSMPTPFLPSAIEELVVEDSEAETSVAQKPVEPQDPGKAGESKKLPNPKAARPRPSLASGISNAPWRRNLPHLTSGWRGWRSRMSRTFPPNLARLMLLCCAALWGGSYLVAKIAMTTMPPQWLMAMRMLAAGVLMLALFHRSILPALHRSIVVPGLIVGVTYYGTMILQTTGLRTIDPGRSAFLTAAYCVLTPFAMWLVYRSRPQMVNVLAGIICLIGVGFIALKPGSSTLALSQGDVLTLLCSLVFTFNLIALAKYSKQFNPIAVTFVQFGVAGVLFVIGALITEPAPNAAWAQPAVVLSFLYLAIGSTTIAQIMQNIGLAHVPATSASIIMCTESLFSVGFSALFWGERIGWNSIAGFAMIFVAMLMSVMKFRNAKA
jgi:drug/metabolite transporter (DMT)-like permease